MPWPAGLQRERQPDAALGREVDVMNRGSRSLAEARNGQAHLHCAKAEVRKYLVGQVGGRRKGLVINSVRSEKIEKLTR